MEQIKNLKLYELLFFLEVKNIFIKFGISVPLNYDESDVYEAISYFYFEETGIKLDNLDEVEKIKLYDWAKEKARYPLLNELIKMQINRLVYKEQIQEDTFDNTDLFIVSNMHSLIDIMLEQYGISATSANVKRVEISKLSKVETDNYVCEILSEIDPTLKWLEIYTKAKEQQRIIYLNELSDEEKKSLCTKFGLEDLHYKNACLFSTDEPYILLTQTGNIDDVVSILHEFAHYITNYYNPNARVQRTLDEFSSQFYELYALLFLNRRGYPKEELLTINTMRLENTMKLISSNASLFHYIRMFYEHLEVTEEMDIKYAKESTDIILSTINEEFLKLIKQNDPDFFEPKKWANKECDRLIENLISEPWQMYKRYPYVIGNYLAIKAIETLSTEKDILYRIKYYTENATTIDPIEVFKGIGCDIDSLKLKETINLNKQNYLQYRKNNS